MKFKIGDRVKCIDIYGQINISLNKIYTIVHEDHKLEWGMNNTFIGIINSTGQLGKYRRDRFVLINNNLPDELFNI